MRHLSARNMLTVVVGLAVAIVASYFAVKDINGERLGAAGLDDDFPAAVAELVVKYICTWHRDPRWILAGRKEWAALRSYPGAYVLSVENGERWYFQSVIILPVALDTFLDVVG